MTIAHLIGLLVNLSMGLIVLSLGLRTSWQDAGYLLQRRDLLFRSLLSMNVLMPVFAVLLVLLFTLNPAIKVAVVAIALSPVPPLLPHTQEKADGTECYIASLLFCASLLSIIVVPLGMLLLEAIFGTGQPVRILDVLPVVVMSVLVPLLAGIFIHAQWRDFAMHYSTLVGRIGTILLVLVAIPIVFVAWPALLAMVGNGTLMALIAFSAAGLLIGHVLGGPDEDNRSVLALASASRHPGVALAIAGAAFPSIEAAAAVVVWHLIVGSLVAMPYVRWRHHMHALGPIVGA